MRAQAHARFAPIRSPAQLSRCSLSNSKSLSGSLLLGESGERLVSFGDLCAALGAVELNVAVRRDVRRDATVSAVSSPAAGDGALNGDVGDNALLGVESLGLGIALQVEQQLTHSLCGLLGPATVLPVVLFRLGVSGNVRVEATEWNNRLVGDDSLHVLDCLSNFHAFDVPCSFVGVLKVRSEISDLSFGRLRGLGGLPAVLNHCKPLLNK